MADIQAVEDWIKKNRPDLLAMWPTLRERDAAILLIGIGYEAAWEKATGKPSWDTT